MQEKNSEKTRKGVVLFRLFAVMLCATLISCHMVSGIWANYATNNDSDSGAKVAVFRVDAQGDTNAGLKQSIKSNTSGDVTQFIVQITNQSETDVSYSLEIVFKNGKNSYFKAWLNNVESNSLSWSNVDVLAPGETADCLLEVKVKDAAQFASAHMGSNDTNSYSDDFDFDTYVTFTQKK